MQTYTTQFIEQIGTTDERIDVTLEYCQDFNGDGLDDIKVTLSVAEESNSGTEDMIGVAFDIQDDSLISDLGLSIEAIESGSPNTDSILGPDVVTGNFGAINIQGGGVDTPYDAAVQFNLGGAGDGIVQEASFILTGDVDLDAEALLENTDWYVRLQSTNGGDGSAKTGGFLEDLPPCEHEPPPPPGEPGTGNTPGFWKQERHFKYWPDAYEPDDLFSDVFGVGFDFNRNRDDSDDSLLNALGARGGQEYALGRAGTAALLNAASTEDGSGMNYAIDQVALEVVALEEGYDLASVLTTLEIIDIDGNSVLGSSEIITAVQDAFGVIAGPLGIQDTAIALDAMNNLPSLEKGDFLI